MRGVAWVLAAAVLGLAALPAVAPSTATAAAAGTAATAPNGAAGAPARETVEGATIRPADILQRAQAAYLAAGTIRAEAALDVTFPTTSTAHLSILSAPNGDVRIESSASMAGDSYQSLTVVSGGVIWTESPSPLGRVVSKIDVNAVKKALPPEQRGFATLPMVGATSLFDVTNFARLVDFAGAAETKLGDRRVYALKGALKESLKSGPGALPEVARRFYATATIYFDADSFFPARIELGGEPDRPALRLSFDSVEKNVDAPANAFSYAPPEGITVVDRTPWTVIELGGKPSQGAAGGR